MSVMKIEALTVIGFEKTFKIIMDLSENQRRKFLKYMSLLHGYYRIVLLVSIKNVYHFKPSMSLQILPSYVSRHKEKKKLIWSLIERV